MEARLIRKPKGNPVLEVNGYRMSFNRGAFPRTYWVCSSYRQGCKARAVTHSTSDGSVQLVSPKILHTCTQRTGKWKSKGPVSFPSRSMTSSQEDAELSRGAHEVRNAYKSGDCGTNQESQSKETHTQDTEEMTDFLIHSPTSIVTGGEPNELLKPVEDLKHVDDLNKKTFSDAMDGKGDASDDVIEMKPLIEAVEEMQSSERKETGSEQQGASSDKDFSITRDEGDTIAPQQPNMFRPHVGRPYRRYMRGAGSRRMYGQPEHHFNYQSTVLLLQLYKQFKDSPNMWGQIASTLAAQGFPYFTADQCGSRFRQVKHRYIRQKRRIDTGTLGRHKFVFYDVCDALFGDDTLTDSTASSNESIVHDTAARLESSRNTGQISSKVNERGQSFSPLNSGIPVTEARYTEVSRESKAHAGEDRNMQAAFANQFFSTFFTGGAKAPGPNASRTTVSDVRTSKNPDAPMTDDLMRRGVLALEQMSNIVVPLRDRVIAHMERRQWQEDRKVELMQRTTVALESLVAAMSRSNT